jgi:hypothetical protein
MPRAVDTPTGAIRLDAIIGDAFSILNSLRISFRMRVASNMTGVVLTI